MRIQKQIKDYISAQTESKRSDLLALHNAILGLKPTCKLWFLDGKDEKGKIVSNPSIGYGSYTMHYADGSEKDFYQVGLSANTSGISVYIMGLKDKAFLNNTFGKSIGKAKVTGYCIKFKSLKDINHDTLVSAIRYRFEGK